MAYLCFLLKMGHLCVFVCAENGLVLLLLKIS